MLVERAGTVVFHGPEEGRIKAFMTRFQILPNEPQHHRVNGNKPDLVALAFDAEVHDALAALHIAQAQQAQFLAPDAVIEQRGKNGAVPYTLQRVRGRGLQQSAGLCVAQGRGAAFIIIGRRTLYAVHRIAEDGIALTEIIEQRRQRRELAPDTGGLQRAGLHILAPGNHMRRRHGTQRRRIFQPGERQELRHIVFIESARLGIGDVGEPFDFQGERRRTRCTGEALTSLYQ